MKAGATHIRNRNVFRHRVCIVFTLRLAKMSEELLRLLGGVGATSQDIAARLGAEGIRGQRGSPTFHNPIVRYICRHLNVGGLIYVPAYSGRLTVVREGTCLTV